MSLNNPDFTKLGATESRLLERIRHEALHMTVLDPEKYDVKKIAEAGRLAEEQGTDIIAIGGSMNVTEMDDKVLAVKRVVHVPVLLFPSNVWSISKYADAILFLRLINSRNLYYSSDVHILSAPIIYRIGIESIPTGYLLFEPGGSAGWVADAKLIPRTSLPFAISCALAAVYTGAHFVFMEAGSGVTVPIEGTIIREVKRACRVPLIVGSGIRTPEQAKIAVENGADIVDTAWIFEHSGSVQPIVHAIKETKRRPI
jgi:phosphoglycerol geranylgeranyltransferase